VCAKETAPKKNIPVLPDFQKLNEFFGGNKGDENCELF